MAGASTPRGAHREGERRGVLARRQTARVRVVGWDRAAVGCGHGRAEPNARGAPPWGGRRGSVLVRWQAAGVWVVGWDRAAVGRSRGRAGSNARGAHRWGERGG